MSKKLMLMLVMLVFLCKFNLAEAQVIINEFVSSGETEWVELLNTGNSPIDLSDWKLTQLSSPDTNPKEASALSLSGVINHILVFNLKSSLLNDSGDSIGLYNGSSLIDRVTFGKVANFSTDISAPQKGKSGALISGNWRTDEEPTKGEDNPGTSTNSEDNSDEEEVIDEEEETNKTVALQKPKVQITSPKIVHVGVPFSMEGFGTGTLGEKLTRGVFYWNFDDGDFREVKAVIKDKFTHTYFYPGDYIVTLLYYPDVFTDTPDTTTEITIKALEPKILISKVGEMSDFFIELTNETGHDADISNWALVSDSKVFTFPKNTNVASNKKMIISPRVSRFSIEDKSSLKLMTPEGEVVFKYMSSIASKTKSTKKSSFVPKNNEEKPSITAKDLTASSILSQSKKDSNSAFSSSSPSSFASIIFLLFMGASAGGVYFIRRRRNFSQKPGDDFEMIDE